MDTTSKKPVVLESQALVGPDGTIYPTFMLENGMYTSGMLKYFHELVGKKVKITITVVDE